MSYRKGEDTQAKRRRRLPIAVVIERDDGFRSVDIAELEAECRRITNSADFLYSRDRFGNHYWHVIRFSEQHQADALKRWLHQNSFESRPAPRFGQTDEEKIAFEREALAWGFRTGAIRRVIQAFRKCNGTLTQQWSAAHQVASTYKMPDGDVAQVFVGWAQRNHPHWFHRWRKPAQTPWEDPNDYPPPDAYPHSEDG